VEDFLDRHGKKGALTAALLAADISMEAGEFVLIALVTTVVLGSVGFFLAGPLVAVVLMALVALGFRAVVKAKASKRRRAFADQLPDVLQMLVSSLRSGMGLTQALDSIAEDADEPARGEFAQVLIEARLGRDLIDGLRVVAERMQSEDLRWILTAIDIQRETGGNLAETLANISQTIRDRQQMKRQVRSLTAEGRLSAYVLTALPVVLALAIKVINPSYFDALTHGAGLAMVVGAVALLGVGWLWMRRIVNIPL
jgi:tight adherence protein B